MDDQAKQIMGQVLIMSVQHLFSMMAMAGKTPEEIDQLLKVELDKFNQRKIEDLPLPPT